MRRIRFLLLLRRPLPRIPYLQCRSDDEHIVQTSLVLRRQQHATNARINRQATQLPPEGRELVLLIHGSQFEQGLIAVAYQRERRRIEKRKFLQRA